MNSSSNQSASPVFDGVCCGNFHEIAGSPTIDAGQNDGANGSTDIDGDPRMIGVTDIGADELVPPAAPGGASATPPRDTTAPVFASASLTNTVFAVNGAGRTETAVASRKRARR